MGKLVQLMKGPRRVARSPHELDPDLSHMDRQRLALIDDLNALQTERERRERLASATWPEVDRRGFSRRVMDRIRRR